MFTFTHNFWSIFIFIHSLEPHNLRDSDYYPIIITTTTIWQIRKLSLRKMKWFGQGKTAKKINGELHFFHSRKNDFHILSFYEAPCRVNYSQYQAKVSLAEGPINNTWGLIHCHNKPTDNKASPKAFLTPSKYSNLLFLRVSIAGGLFLNLPNLNTYFKGMYMVDSMPGPSVSHGSN